MDEQPGIDESQAARIRKFGARVCGKAEAGEILVSRTISDLLVGSGISLVPRGSHELKGVPGEWQLLAVAAEESPVSEHEELLADIEIGSPRSAERGSDRAAAAVARRAPGAIRTVMRLDPRYRRSVKSR